MPEKDTGTVLLTEYYSTVKMTIMREGTWQDFEMTPKLMREIADSYDPDALKAPLVIDHVRRGPAFGHVLSLEAVSDDDADGEVHLDAEVGLTAEGNWLVKSGAYPERSIFIRSDYPFDGIWYLCHLSLIGADNPRVTGMGPVITLPDDDTERELVDVFAEAFGTDTAKELVGSLGGVAFIWEKTDEYIRHRVRAPSRFVKGSFRTDKTWGPAKKGIYRVAGRLLPKYRKEGQSEWATQALLFAIDKGWTMSRAKAWVKSHKNLSAEGGIDAMAEDVTKTGTEEEAGTRAADKDTQIAELTARAESAEADAKKAAAELDRVQIQSTIDTMLAAGKLLPAHVEMGIVDALSAVPADAKVGDKSVRDVILGCISHDAKGNGQLRKEAAAETTGNDEKSRTGKVDNRDLDALEKGERARVLPGTVDAARRARELIASGTPANEAYLQAQRELAEEGES